MRISLAVEADRAVAVEVQFAVSKPRGLEIRRWADAVIVRMADDPNATEVCIRVVDEQESRTLNSHYRQQNKATNVLSFPADVRLPDSEERYLGDVVICDPVVQREAQTQNKNVRDHYAHMVVHGMLHLYGHDHVDETGAEVMEDIEREILDQVGVADPYRQT